MNDIVGYFAWTKSGKPGEFYPQKYDKQRQQMNPEATKYYVDKTLKSWPLTAEEFAMSLDQLAKKYPI